MTLGSASRDTSDETRATVGPVVCQFVSGGLCGGVVGAEGSFLIGEEATELAIRISVAALSAYRVREPVSRPVVQRFGILRAEYARA